MKVPRDLSGKDLAQAMRSLEYRVTRQEGSHIRLTTTLDGEHHITVPAHDPLKIGTLSGIFTDLQSHHRLSRQELLRRLFA